MPGPFRAHAGVAAFINGFLDQDEIQQRQQLEFLESIAGAASTAQDIRGRQADQYRAAALFPGQMEQQGLQTSQMGIQTEEAQRDLEWKQKLDAHIQDTYGYPNWEVYKYMRDSGGMEVVNRAHQRMLETNAPETQVDLQNIQNQQAFQQAQAYGELQGPQQAGYGAAISAGFKRDLEQSRREGNIIPAMVRSEREQAELAPSLTRSQIFQNYASGEAAKMRAMSSEMAKENAEQQAFISYYGSEEEGMLEWARNKVISAGISAKRVLPLPQIVSGLQDIEMTLYRLESGEVENDQAMTQMLAGIMAANSGMFGGQKVEEGEVKTKEEIKAILQPLFNYYNLVHKEMDPGKRLYTDIAMSRAMGSQSQAAQRHEMQPQFGEAEINTAIGNMQSAGSRATTWTSQEVARGAKNYMRTLINKYRPDEWEAMHQIMKPQIVAKSSEQDWQATLETIRELERIETGGIR